MEKRIAAYAYFLVGGMASACLGLVLLLGPRIIEELFAFAPGWNGFIWEVVLAGVAAVLGAGAVQQPFLRAVSLRRRGRMWLWVLAGVVASHAAYVALFIAHDTVSSPATSFFRHVDEALAIGLFSVVLGFLPNMLLGIGFAETLLWLGRQRPAAAPG